MTRDELKQFLLRNLDKIKSCSIEEAQNMFDGFSPNALILHCQKLRKAMDKRKPCHRVRMLR